MRENGPRWILNELAGLTGCGSEVGRGYGREAEIPETGIIASGSAVQPKRMVDAMAFSQGHLMSNKKCMFQTDRLSSREGLRGESYSCSEETTAGGERDISDIYFFNWDYFS